MTDLVKCGLEEVAVILKRLGRIVEQLEGRLAADVAAAQQKRQHQAGGGRTDGTRQKVLREPQSLNIGFGVRGEAGVAAGGEFREGSVSALGAEIARDRRFQIADGH